MTSHDVVAICRRAYAERSIGHLGTLDPFATGLLVLLLGRATRLATFIAAEPKVYDATVQFGVETDTDDGTGSPVRTAAPPNAGTIRTAVMALTGEIEQIPPAYSAKHVPGHGGRAYASARRGQAVALPPARVRVYAWDLRALREDAADFTVTCGGGTYVRALARDLGRLSGSAAHLAALRRTRVGPFDVARAHTLPAITQSPPPPLRALHVIADD
jgi:tRNA pseudouridine55 synthase